MVSAGAKLRAVDIPLGAVTTYSPTWTASTTSPTHYTGEGWYMSIGYFTWFHAFFTCDASFTDGSGIYIFQLPVAMSASIGLEHRIGVSSLRHPGTSARYDFGLMPSGAGSQYAYMMYGSTTVSPVTDTSPVTPVTGDMYSMHGWYFTG